MKNQTKEKEMIKNNALLIPGNHAKLMFLGNQPLMVLDEDLSDKVNKELYLIDNEWCYGTLRILPPRKLSFKEFNHRKNLHLCTEDEIAEMDTTSLFEYPYQWIKKFETINRWKTLEGDDFKNKIEIINEQKKTLSRLERVMSEFSDNMLYSIQPNYEGIETFLLKSKNFIKLMHKDNNISEMFPHIIESASKISDSEEFILSGKLIFYDFETGDLNTDTEDLKNKINNKVIPGGRSKFVVYNANYVGD